MNNTQQRYTWKDWLILSIFWLICSLPVFVMLYAYFFGEDFTR